MGGGDGQDVAELELDASEGDGSEDAKSGGRVVDERYHANGKVERLFGSGMREVVFASVFFLRSAGRIRRRKNTRPC